MAVTALQNDPQNLIDILKALPKTLKPRLEAYTDGACSGNPGPGGWGAVVMSMVCVRLRTCGGIFRCCGAVRPGGAWRSPPSR